MTSCIMGGVHIVIIRAWSFERVVLATLFAHKTYAEPLIQDSNEVRMLSISDISLATS
jgi:hypothetical protein